MSKRIGLIAVLALVLVLSVAAGVFAAQNSAFDNVNGTSDFAGPNSFTADGTNGYPSEIYLPNEQAPGDYRIHSNYTSTTDACASCHATHTGAGEALLQWGTVYDTCMACHDGTVTTTYDVKHGEIGSTGTRTSGGLFGGTNSASNHNVTGALSVYAAPGGPGTAGVEPTPVVDNHGDKVNWDVEFGCQSCHSPHGQGGNPRLLNPDVNGYAWANKQTGRALTKVDDVTYTSDWNGDGAADTWIQGYPYTSKVYVDGAATTVTVDNTAGYTKVIFGSAPAGAVTADFYPALVVKMQVANYLAENESVTHISGLNTFCGACHADYNTSAVSSPGSNLNGTYTEAYRHKVGFDRTKSLAKLTPLNMKLEATGGKNNVTCETCHVAHGTDEQYWVDTLAASGIDASELRELAGSSALKRLPNMGTCEACHAKGTGNQGYSQVVNGTSELISGTPGGGYVGQDACANCHTEKYKEFQETWHPNKTRPGVTEEVAELAETADFSVINAAIKTATGQDVDVKAEIEATEAELAKVIVNANGTEDYTAVDPAKITIWSWGKDASRIAMRGSKVYGTAIGTTQGDSWYTVASSDEVDHNLVFNKQNVSQYTCFSGCHTTGYDTTKAAAKEDGYDNNSSDLTHLWLNKVTAGLTPAFDAGVTCEACHGQAGNHVKAPSQFNIVNPNKLSVQVQTVGLGAPGTTNTLMNNEGKAKSCGNCHSSATHQADFFNTGQYDNHGIYPYAPTKADPKNTYTPSQHFVQGVLSCNGCHNSHALSPVGNQLRMKSPSTAEIGKELCGTCHSNIVTIADIEYYMPRAGTEEFGIADSHIRKHGATSTQREP